MTIENKVEAGYEGFVDEKQVFKLLTEMEESRQNSFDLHKISQNQEAATKITPLFIQEHLDNKMPFNRYADIRPLATSALPIGQMPIEQHLPLETWQSRTAAKISTPRLPMQAVDVDCEVDNIESVIKAKKYRGPNGKFLYPNPNDNSRFLELNWWRNDDNLNEPVRVGGYAR